VERCSLSAVKHETPSIVTGTVILEGVVHTISYRMESLCHAVPPKRVC
jgi:hypothetical protein